MTSPTPDSSPEKSTSRPRRRWLRVLLGCLISFLLLVTIAASVLHVVILPRLDDYRPRIAEIATRFVGHQIHIGKLSVIDNSPLRTTVVVEELQVDDLQGSPGLEVQRIEASLTPWSTLRLGVAHLTVQAPHLQAQRLADGQVTVASFPLSTSDDTTGDAGPALNWLLAQPSLRIEQGSAQWTDFTRDVPPLVLSQITASLTNNGNEHKLQVSATPPDGWGQPMTLISEWNHSRLHERSDWKFWDGAAYLDLPHLDISELRRYVGLGSGIELQRGRGSLRAWTDFQHMRNSTATMQATLDEVAVKLHPNLPAFALKNLESTWSIQAEKIDGDHGNYHLSTQQLDFTLMNDRRWPGGNIHIDIENGTTHADSRGSLKGDNWDMAIIGMLASSLPLGDAANKALRSYQPSGHMEELEVTWTGPLDQPVHYTAKGHANNLAWLSQKGAFDTKAKIHHPGIPGVQGANVVFDLNDQQGEMHVTMQNGRVDLPGVFDEPVIPFDSLGAKVDWQRNGDAIHVNIPQASFSSPDATGVLNLEWNTSPVPLGGNVNDRFPGAIRLDATLEKARANRVYRYLPLVLGDVARDYVKNAILGGDIRQARVRIQGDLNDIPSQNPKSQSVFRFEVPLQNATYRFMPTQLQARGELPWPTLTQLNGKLIIDGFRLMVTNAQGRFDTAPDMHIRELTAQIPNLAKDLTVEVSAKASGPLQQAMNLTRLSPLSTLAHNALDQATATGYTNVALMLGLPIHDMRKLKVQGGVELLGNDVRISPSTPLLSRSTGAVTFSETGFALRDIRTQLLGGAARLQGGLDPTGKTGSKVQFTAQGIATDKGLQNERGLPLVAPLAGYMRGQTQYNASLRFDHGVPELRIDTDLHGMELMLPAPLEKVAEQRLPVHIENTIVRQQRGLPAEDQLLIRVGDQALVHYVRDVSKKKPIVVRGTLAIGEEAMSSLPPMPDKGVQAIAMLDYVDLYTWTEVGNKVFAPTPTASSSNAPAHTEGDALEYLPSVVGGLVKTLHIDNRQFDDVVIGASRENRLWKTSLSAQQANGYAEYLQSMQGGPDSIMARLEHLTIPAVIVENFKELVRNTEDPLTLPALDLQIKNLDLVGYKLEDVNVLAGGGEHRVAGAPISDQDEHTNSDNAWRIHSLSARAPHTYIEGSGLWGNAPADPNSTHNSARRMVALNLRVESQNVGSLLDHFDLKNTADGGNGVVAGSVRWRGSPISIDLPTLNGLLRVDVRNGGITKVDLGAFKLLNLFSLPALSRMGQSSKGFSYDRISGALRLNQGVLSTDNAQVIGTSLANVQVQGQTSLIDQTLDFDVLVQPKVDFSTASLALATVNPLLGLGSYAAQWLLSQSINTYATQVMHVQGPWKNPVMTTVRGEEANRKAAAILSAEQAPSIAPRLWDWTPISGRNLRPATAP
mgnify:FL=1